jgi:GTP cyclohydrolase I
MTTTYERKEKRSRRMNLREKAELLESSNASLREANDRMRMEIERLRRGPEELPPPSLNSKLMEQAIEALLEGMGVSLEDPNFKDTPKRVARMWIEMLTPAENNWTTFPGGTYDEIILLRGHVLHGFCPHHLLPVKMKAYVAYIPQKQVLGLSKLARVCEQFLTKPVMQEELTRSICDELWNRLEPKAAGVIIAGEHSCMSLRGVESEGDAVTSAMKGAFLLNPAARQELIALIGRP